jgi:hypothetical protein
LRTCVWFQRRKCHHQLPSYLHWQRTHRSSDSELRNQQVVPGRQFWTRYCDRSQLHVTYRYSQMCSLLWTPTSNSVNVTKKQSKTYKNWFHYKQNCCHDNDLVCLCLWHSDFDSGFCRDLIKKYCWQQVWPVDRDVYSIWSQLLYIQECVSAQFSDLYFLQDSGDWGLLVILPI